MWFIFVVIFLIWHISKMLGNQIQFKIGQVSLSFPLTDFVRIPNVSMCREGGGLRVLCDSVTYEISTGRCTLNRGTYVKSHSVTHSQVSHWE